MIFLSIAENQENMIFTLSVFTKMLFFIQWFIQCNTYSCREHITGGVHLYRCVSLLAPECAVCLCLYICVVPNHILRQTSVNLTRCCIKQQVPSSTKVSGLDMCRSIVPLSKITHQMWRDHPLSQRNKGKKSSWVGVWKRGRGWTKFEKGGVGNIEGSL